jgi:hypothetical protein
MISKGKPTTATPSTMNSKEYKATFQNQREGEEEATTSLNYDDDSSLESFLAEDQEDSFSDEEVYTVSIETSKDQKPSDLRCYKETTSFSRLFQSQVVDNPRNVCTTSRVAGLCGLNLQIFYRHYNNTDVVVEAAPSSIAGGNQRGRRSRSKLPINKIATMLTFDPNTGLYNHLIRGKAYVTLDDGRTKLSRRTLWAIQELIAESKGSYHQYGADFSREGQMGLLRACVQFKKGKWVPRSVYGMALAKTEDIAVEHQHYCLKAPQCYEELYTVEEEREADAPMTRSSSSRWFISTIQLE